MEQWKDRPIFIANLFNPAFCSILLFDSVLNYYEKNEQKGMPYPVIFLILPLILHKVTRDSLPKTTSAIFHQWIQKYPWIKVDFAKRTSKFIPITKEAIIFGSEYGLFSISNGLIAPRKLNEKKLIWETNTEVAECRNKAQFLGKWFSKISDISLVYIMLGIQP